MSKPNLPSNPIDQYIVCEVLGNFSFSKNQENDIAYAEEIASNTYYSMEDLKRTILGKMPSHVNFKKFEKSWEVIKTNSYFDNAFKNNP